MVVAAQDVRDPVEPVLDRRCEVIGRPAVGADDDEVLDLFVRVLDPPANEVVPGGDALVGHPHPDRPLVLVRLLLLEKTLRLLAAVLHAVELKGELAVPVHAEPAQRLLDLIRRVFHLAARVRVLDPQAELAALVAREEPVEERRVDVPDVEVAGRARGEADDWGHGDIVGAC